VTGPGVDWAQTVRDYASRIVGERPGDEFMGVLVNDLTAAYLRAHDVAVGELLGDVDGWEPQGIMFWVAS
jgi:hypothetical protein